MKRAGIWLLCLVIFVLISLAGCGQTTDDARRVETTGEVLALVGADGHTQVVLDIDGWVDTLEVTTATWNSLSVGQDVDVACIVSPAGGHEVCWLTGRLE